MKLNQFSFVRNTATTGHKLQGKTVDSILAYAFEYRVNWPYVVMSRVTTMSGLYLREKLSDDLSHYTVPPELTEMLVRLRNREPQYLDFEAYEEVAEANAYQSTHLSSTLPIVSPPLL